MLEVASIDRINSAEDHGMNFLKTRQGGARGITLIGNGVTDFYLGSTFDIGNEVADIARIQTRLRIHFRRKYPHFLNLIARIVAHEFNRLVGFHFSRNDAHVADNAPINVEHRIENESAQDLV